MWELGRGREEVGVSDLNNGELWSRGDLWGVRMTGEGRLTWLIGGLLTRGPVDAKEYRRKKRANKGGGGEGWRELIGANKEKCGGVTFFFSRGGGDEIKTRALKGRKKVILRK